VTICKSFTEFAAELAAGLVAGRGDELRALERMFRPCRNKGGYNLDDSYVVAPAYSM
jgi:hypothetical protein